MELLEAIAKRRSVRVYKKQEVQPESMEKILGAAVQAPSGGNVQPWAFVVARSEATKMGISKAAFGQRALQEASVIIVVCADEKRAAQSYGSRGKTLYCLQDTAAAIQNILLTAVSLGLGACWMGAFKEDEVRGVIEAPKHMRPVALIPIGYPDESPPARPRRSLSEVMYKETF